MRSATRAAPTLDHEIAFGHGAGRVVCGIDEVGKGSWAGPLVVGVAVLRDDVPCDEIPARDSKSLSEKRREAMFDTVAAACRAWSLGIASAGECDRLGMSAAQKLATSRALAQLAGVDCVPDVALVDGRWDFVAPLVSDTKTFVGGESVSMSIAVASILAKVSRDRMMRSLADELPHWSFATNKGYSCPRHLAGLIAHGVSREHRVTWGYMQRLGIEPPR
jgi:ribonuclease HII